MKHSLSRRITIWMGDRLSLIGLWISYPVVAMLAMISGASESDDFQWIAIILAACIVMLATDASVRSRRRIRLTRGRSREFDKDIFWGSTAILSPLIAIVVAQDMLRRMLSIEKNPEALSVLGYTPGEDSFFYLAMLGGLWVILIAYIGKYRWDRFIELREEAIKEARNLKRQERRSKIANHSTSNTLID